MLPKAKRRTVEHEGKPLAPEVDEKAPKCEEDIEEDVDWRDLNDGENWEIEG
jgi:hypothetical protein